MQTDKAAFFTVMPEDMFQEKALVSMQKGFTPVSVKDTKVRQQAVTLSEELNLEGLREQFKKAKNNHIKVFFAAK